MPEMLNGILAVDALGWLVGFFSEFKNYLLIFIGFSLVIFVHELGHFAAAKWCNVRVDKFAVGFGKELFGFTRGETRYSFNVLPLGGYVKMLGQEDFTVDKSGELKVKHDPRAFTHKPIRQRMLIVSAGVVMNVVFAALVFMLVFMIGVDFPPAEVGFVQMESPAEQAGLLPGDRILKIDAQEVADFQDVFPAILLSDPAKPLSMLIARQDPETGEDVQLTLELRPERYRDEGRRQVGVGPPMTNLIAFAVPDPAVSPEEQLQPGDRIVAVNGEPVDDLYEINRALVERRGEFASLAVQRPSPETGDPIELLRKRRARLTFRPTAEGPRETGHLLGLVPRREVTLISPGEPADIAGFQAGDVIVRWGNRMAPTLAEVLQSVGDNPGRELPVTIRRRVPGGEDRIEQLRVTPSTPGWFKGGSPRIGMDPYGQEEDRLVVAEIVARVNDEISTPAAPLRGILPRGALLTRINDEPVGSWTELAQRFIELAGSDVKLTWSYENQPEQSASIYVPQTLETALGVPLHHRITRINDETHIEIMEKGRPKTYTVQNWRGAQEILRNHVGQTVWVEHRAHLEPEPVRREVQVLPEMLDTWVQRIEYNVVDGLFAELVMAKIREPNPVKATMIGIRKTYYFIEQVYMMMRRMIFTRSVDLDQISGPVGIVKLGSDIARHDLVKLMYFLALISANLAVINFLPLPIVDGGLFVFLIIEKIKGSPISVRVQVATQLIGLMLIIGIFLYVTIQDVQRLFG